MQESGVRSQESEVRGLLCNVTGKRSFVEGQVSGFTLIEILVSLAILGVIVVSIASLFDQSTVAWDSGLRRSQAMMTGRAILDFAATEAALAMDDSNLSGGSVPSMNNMLVLEGTNEMADISYTPPGSGIERTRNTDTSDLIENGDDISIEDFSIDFGGGQPPRYADIAVTVQTSDKGRDEDRDFETRVYLWNHNRYRYDVE